MKLNAAAIRYRNKTTRGGLFVLGLVIATTPCVWLTGCSLVPEAKADPTRFYVLSTNATGLPASSSKGPSVQLKAIDLSSYLRGRALIVRRGNNELEFREFARWGEPLDAGIGRVLREELLARGAVGSVSAAGMRRDATPPDLTLTVRVLACEGGLGGTVTFRAVWELTGAATAGTNLIARGDFRPTDLQWDGRNEASLVAQLSQAVASLAGEISAALPKT